MSATQHEFKAEVKQLLDIVIHSLYSDREIFLRELISNSADALDKARFEGLTKDLVALAGEIPGIRLTVDAENKTLTLDDDGIGMSQEEVIENLGTIAHSGTGRFLEQLKDAEPGDAPQLIGQFGVGFYSAYMVADEVVVDTLSATPGSEPVRWRSRGDGTYEIEPGERKFRGTRVTLHLREDAEEFADTTRVRGIVRKHSNYLPWPILVDGEEANAGEAVWAKSPSQVTDEEAASFYKSIAADWRDPIYRLHTSADMPIQYHAMLFIPEERPYDLYFPDSSAGVRLYARRVLIMEAAEDILPKWLRFVRGVVDSEDIQLNLSREMVQRTPVVQKIRKALINKLLKDLARLPDRPHDEEDEGSSPEERYERIWQNFGMLLKEGYYQDKYEFGDLLLPLLRFNTLSCEDGHELISLADYKEEMPEGQDTVWYLTAQTREEALASPHLEAFRKRGWDVLLLTEPVDEWLVQALTEYEDLPLKSVARGELELEDEEDGAEKADLSGLAPWLKERYGDAISDVRESSRLTDSAVVLVDDEAGISANMERILRSANQAVPHQARILELNSRHSLIRSLARLHEAERSDVLEPMAQLLLDNAVLMDGNVTEPAAMGRRLQDLLLRVAGLELSRDEDPATSGEDA